MNEASAAPWPVLSRADFHRISQLAHERFGLDLPEGKEGLVVARLGKKIRQGGFVSFSDYYHHVLADRTGGALTELIDALTTNFTSFLREPAHFDYLRDASTTEFRNVSPLRVWSAACSSGEEPYSIAMALLEAAPGCNWAGNIQITASDISTRVLKHAREAIYPAEKFTGIPDSWRRTYLLKGIGARTGSFKLKPLVTGLVQFERLNLIEPFPSRRFHFIFCRNVMIYFSRETQQAIVSRFAACLESGGYLFVGHSESLNGIGHSLRYVQPSVYRNPCESREKSVF